MTDLRKAAEMALEALDYHFDNQDDYLNWKYPLVLEAKQALRQALAQPEQEPVAWLYQNAYGDKLIHKKEHATFYEPNGTFTPLYTAPPKREWVGLTDEEIEEYKWMGQDVIAVIKEIQAILKEKNT